MGAVAARTGAAAVARCDQRAVAGPAGAGLRAAAASVAPGTVRTETNGSIICPFNVNVVVGFNPTVGLLSQDFIMAMESLPHGLRVVFPDLCAALNVGK